MKNTGRVIAATTALIVITAIQSKPGYAQEIKEVNVPLEKYVYEEWESKELTYSYSFQEMNGKVYFDLTTKPLTDPAIIVLERSTNDSLFTVVDYTACPAMPVTTSFALQDTYMPKGVSYYRVRLMEANGDIIETKSVGLKNTPTIWSQLTEEAGK